MRDIGKNIRAVRTRAGLTQDQLAERLHVTRQTVSNYETGRSRPDVETLLALAEALEADVKELLYGPQVPPDRRRGFRLLVIGCVLTVLLALPVVLLPTLPDVHTAHLFYGPLLMRKALLLPCLWLVLAWTSLQACGLFLHLTPLRQAWTVWPRRVLLAAIAAYLVLLLPLGVYQLKTTLELYALYRQGGDLAYSSSFSFFPLWDRITVTLLRWFASRDPLFLLPGAALWMLGFPAERKG